MKIFFDGGLRPLPLGMEIAVVAAGRAEITRGLGDGTSMDAEWLALIAAARLAHDRTITDPVLVGDAAAVVLQATGRVRVPAVHREHHAAFDALRLAIGGLRLRHVRRTQNLAGIALAAAREDRQPRVAGIAAAR